MTSIVQRAVSGVAIVFALALAVPEAEAQMHAEGSTWIHRGSEHATMLHADGDSLCLLEFPDGCLGNGMMGPDSIYCEFALTPPDSAPHDCVVVVHCEVYDEGGADMMPNHRTPHGLFQREVNLTIHYDADYVASLGIDPENLVVTTWAGETLEVVGEATHDIAAAVFRFPSSKIASWYGIADSSNLPVAVEEINWGQVKDTYR